MSFVARLRHHHKRAFVFSAGGALGAFQVGQIKAVVDAGIIPDVLIGVSVGSLNASFMSDGVTSERAHLLGDLWKTGQIEGIMDESLFQRGLRVAKRASFLYNSDPLEKIISEICRRCDPDLGDIASANTELHILACDLITGSEYWFSNGSAKVAMLASSTVPGVLKPVEHDGRLLIDGGVHTPLPINKAIELGCDEVWAFSVPRLNQTGVEDLSALGVLVRSFTIARWAGSEPPRGSRATIFELPTPSIPSSSPAAFKRVSEYMEKGEESANIYIDTLRALDSDKTGKRQLIPRMG